MRAALALVTRRKLAPVKTKRTGKAKGRTSGGGKLGMRARLDKKRVAKKVARIPSLTNRIQKMKPKRPDDPHGPKSGPR